MKISNFLILTLASVSALVACRTDAFVTYKEADDPVAVSDRSKAAWVNIGKLEAVWASADSLYSRSEVPVVERVEVNHLSGWRGERISAQLLLYTGNGADGVRCEVKDFRSSSSVMSADIAQARFVRYTIADRGGMDCRCNRGPEMETILVPDMIDSLKVFNMDPRTVRPVWVTVNVPHDAEPGVYKSEIVVKSKGTSRISLPFELEVVDQVLPDYREWNFHLDLWQHPSAIARALNLELWSDEHFEAIKQHMRPLAEAGQKVITTTLNRDPWGYQCYDDYEHMIIWTLKKYGSWSYDYTIFDRYVETMMELGVKKQINCYSMIPWNNSLSWYVEDSNAFISRSCPASSDLFEKVWGPFLTDFVKHLREKGWLEITNIAADERSPEEMDAVLKVMQKYAPELGFAMADNHASFRRYPNVKDCCVAQRQDYMTQNEIDERRAKGYVTTFYVCCSTYFPNCFTYSQPWESELLNWHAISKDYDGQLRWAYNSWPHRPEYDSRFRYWGSGDTYQMYPYARPSMRFERMRDGVECFEKVRILREKFAAQPELLKPLEDHLDKMAALKLTDTSLPWHAMMEEAVALLDELSRK